MNSELFFHPLYCIMRIVRRTGEKAIKRYPHSFAVARECASIYIGFGVEERDKALFRRALEFSERSRMLIDQNNDPKISDQTICGRLLRSCRRLGKRKVHDP